MYTVDCSSVGPAMSDILTAQERKELESATRLAEHGNGSLLRDLVENEKDFDKHTRIINEMMNLNQQHLHTFEIQSKQGLNPSPVGRLRLEEVPRTVDGDLIITRSLSNDGQTVFREVYNKSRKTYIDSGSCPRPSGIVPHFIPRSK